MGSCVPWLFRPSSMVVPVEHGCARRASGTGMLGAIRCSGCRLVHREVISIPRSRWHCPPCTAALAGEPSVPVENLGSFVPNTFPKCPRLALSPGPRKACRQPWKPSTSREAPA